MSPDRFCLAVDAHVSLYSQRELVYRSIVFEYVHSATRRMRVYTAQLTDVKLWWSVLIC